MALNDKEHKAIGKILREAMDLIDKLLEMNRYLKEQLDNKDIDILAERYKKGLKEDNSKKLIEKLKEDSKNIIDSGIKNFDNEQWRI